MAESKIIDAFIRVLTSVTVVSVSEIARRLNIGLFSTSTVSSSAKNTFMTKFPYN